MGCASTMNASAMRVLPLPPQLVNSYIDKYPPIVVYKLKQKFTSYCENGSIFMTELQFERMYQSCHSDKLGQNTIKWMFKYYSDNSESSVKFKHFMAKYATITKCQPKNFIKILFYVYKESQSVEQLSESQYNKFYLNEKSYFKSIPVINSFPLTLQAFISHLIESFDVQRYQNQLILTTESDIPFQSINRQLMDCDFNDLMPGQSYYVLSAAWFSRWAFYYQQINYKFETEHIKSTKMLIQDKYRSKKRTRRDLSVNLGKPVNGSLRDIDSSTLIQQPNTIQFGDLEGQYIYELKQNIKTNIQCKIVNQKLWKLLVSLHQPEQIFKRQAIDSKNIEYYPKAIYYCQGNLKGEIIVESQKVLLLSTKQKLQYFLTKGPQESIFSKNFNEKNWRLQTSLSKTLADCSIQPRFFILKTQDKTKFMGQNQRKQITAENITVGDKVYAYFAFQKSSCEAQVIKVLPQNMFKVHFKGYNYRYECDIHRDDLSVIDNDPNLSSGKKKYEPIIKGIINIGNTCFINSVIQCLVATPILDQYFDHQSFNQVKQPLLYYLAQITKKLLKNQKVFPQNLKKSIDINMPAFSGYDQHDAQQFLNILLDKLSQQLKDKPTIIDYLFGGKIQSKLTCQSCKKQKINEENLYILSLPIPQPEYNCFTIIVVPVSSRSMKKIVIRLHKNATIANYIEAFEQRTEQDKNDFIFCEVSFGSLRKTRNQVLMPSLQTKRIVDVGIVPNISLQAYEKLNKRVYFEILAEKENSKELEKFKDIQHPTEAYWTICKVGETKGDKLALQIVNQQNQIQKLKIDKKTQLTYQKLGNKTTQLSYKKIVLRKMNSTLKRLDHFGIQFLVGIPKWASYNDVLRIVNIYIDNLKSKDLSKSNKQDEEGKDYIIRLLDASKLRCIFCGQDNASSVFKTLDSLKKCCNVFQKDLPLQFSAKIKSYWIYIDWIDFAKCNSTFCSYIQIDQQSKRAQQTSNEQKINLDECMKLYQQPQNVEMKCDSCKHEFQRLQNTISQMPNILVIHMKQFRYTPEGHLIKLDIHLKWQEYLDSSKYSMNMQGKIYELFAIVRHSGNSQSGHYTCMAKRKHPFENKKVWINFDDDITDVIKTEQKNIDDAYLLFYKKVDMPTSAFVNFTDLSQNMYQK